MCADAGECDSRPGTSRTSRYRSRTSGKPRPIDALNPNTCLRCGLVAVREHRTPDDCIEQSRDKLAQQGGD